MYNWGNMRRCSNIAIDVESITFRDVRRNICVKTVRNLPDKWGALYLDVNNIYLYSCIPVKMYNVMNKKYKNKNQTVGLRLSDLSENKVRQNEIQ